MGTVCKFTVGLQTYKFQLSPSRLAARTRSASEGTASFHYSSAMHVDRVFRGTKVTRDLLVEHAPHDQGHCLFFPGRERLETRAQTVELARSWRPTCERSRARSIAASSSLASTGLVRKSTAPPFIARTFAGMSPLPVRNTMGTQPRALIVACSSSPFS